MKIFQKVPSTSWVKLKYVIAIRGKKSSNIYVLNEPMLIKIDQDIQNLQQFVVQYIFLSLPTRDTYNIKHFIQKL